MGAVDENRIVEIRNNPPVLILEIGLEQEQRTFEISEETAKAVSSVLSERPFGGAKAGGYSYWIRSLQCTEGRDWILFRGKRRDFKIGVRIKLNTKRSLVMLPCTEQEYDALCDLFPSGGIVA